jgi:hypothetical protein
MHLESMRNWMITYIGFAVFDVIVTYICLNQPPFGIEDEGNSLIRTLMEQFGLWQGLTIYLIQEFVAFFALWIGVLYLFKYLLRKRSEAFQLKVDILIFNLFVPFIIMASALLHLFGGISWIGYAMAGELNSFFPMQFFVYITVICGILQAYHVFKLTSTSRVASEKLLISE